MTLSELAPVASLSHTRIHARDRFHEGAHDADVSHVLELLFACMITPVLFKLPELVFTPCSPAQDATSHVSHCTLAMQGHCSTFIDVNRILDCNLTTRKSCSGCPPTMAMQRPPSATTASSAYALASKLRPLHCTSSSHNHSFCNNIHLRKGKLEVSCWCTVTAVRTVSECRSQGINNAAVGVDKAADKGVSVRRCVKVQRMVKGNEERRKELADRRKLEQRQVSIDSTFPLDIVRSDVAPKRPSYTTNVWPESHNVCAWLLACALIARAFSNVHRRLSEAAPIARQPF
jgi:hypothetical protein